MGALLLALTFLLCVDNSTHTQRRGVGYDIPTTHPLRHNPLWLIFIFLPKACFFFILRVLVVKIKRFMSSLLACLGGDCGREKVAACRC